ncbi:uncharacterized protein ACIBXB_010493 [Morphnus guianensis]
MTPSHPRLVRFEAFFSTVFWILICAINPRLQVPIKSARKRIPRKNGLFSSMRFETGANDPHLHPSCECAATSSLKYLPKKMCLLLKITFSWRDQKFQMFSEALYVNS